MNGTPYLQNLPPLMTLRPQNFGRHKMKLLAYVTLLLALSSCASLPNAQPPETPPKLQATPAWILEPGPNLQELLDKLILISETPSTTPPASLTLAKQN